MKRILTVFAAALLCWGAAADEGMWMINAINRANDAQRQELKKWIDAKDFDRNEKVAAVTKLYDEIGIRQLCEQKMEECYQLALQYLAKVEVSEERKAELKAYAAEMMTRQS